ncbi:MAG: hypothetical protein Q4G70_01915 [Pseudomonadota bacterium]|nr:hypothetical protein [Pseudomonadota bacterium]
MTKLNKTLMARILAGLLTLGPAWAMAQVSAPTPAPAAEEHEEEGMDGPPVAISTTAWEHRVRLATDNLNRGITDSLGPGIRLATAFTHQSGLVAELELGSVSRKIFTNGSGVALTLGGGWRGGNPEGWNYGIGAAYEYFPGTYFDAPLQLTFDQNTGEPQPFDFQRTKLDTGYALFELGYGPLRTRLLAVLTKHYRGTNSGMVCGTLSQGADPMAGLNCYANGPRNSRGSLLFDVDYKIPLNGNITTLNLHAGYQHVRNFSQMNFADIGIGVTHNWQGFEITAEAAKPFTRNRELFMVMDGDKVRRIDKPKFVVSVTKRF